MVLEKVVVVLLHLVGEEKVLATAWLRWIHVLEVKRATARRFKLRVNG